MELEKELNLVGRGNSGMGLEGEIASEVIRVRRFVYQMNSQGGCVVSKND